jgi:glyoxalase family protein
VWRERLLQAGLRVSPVMDRVYFKSIYTNDPDGHIVELATAGPGFAVDEDVAALGTSLKLPPWLEPQRRAIESTLRPIRVPAWVPAEAA